jgi:glucose/arabinose dehydrogenase
MNRLRRGVGTEVVPRAVAGAVAIVAATTMVGLAHIVDDPAGPGQARPSIEVGLEPFAAGLDNPVALAAPGDGSDRLYVAEKPGRVRLIDGGRLDPEPILDIRDRVESRANERGLLGLAFHPDYAANGLLVVGYTAKSPEGRVTYSSFRSAADGRSVDPATERIILSFDHPRGNHNGGHVAFGPDGYLYLGTGDGGGGGDPDRNGQNGATLLGKMLRIDPDGGSPYAVPNQNPFVGDDGVRDEIWALGLRNPWRYSFDRLTGDLFIGDVGQNEVEEIDYQPAASRGGENYGWSVMEGSRCYRPTDCDRDGLTLPVVEYGHDEGCSVTGGYVYRGSRFPALFGTYFFADYCSNTIWGAWRGESGGWTRAPVGRGSGGIQAFGEDDDGELYVLTGSGEALRLVAAGVPPATAVPSASPSAATPALASPTVTTTVTATRTASTGTPRPPAALSLPWLAGGGAPAADTNRARLCPWAGDA